jgi:phage baseplate assembly protein W
MIKLTSQKQSLATRLGSDARMPIAGNFETVAGLDVLLQDIQRLLLTIPGERPMRPTFGCNLRNQIWENMGIAAEAGAAAIEEALHNFEPRVTVIGVDSTANDNTGLITFNIRFVVNSDDSAVSLIFPFRVGTQLSFA